jgi:hypothetical protein
MKKQPCRLETLARSELCSVDYCHGCDAFHVNIGFATLHFDLATLRLINGTLAGALNRFENRAAAHHGAAEPLPEANGNLH